MSKTNFESAIAALERTAGPPESLLAAAASTLGIDLEASIASSSEKLLPRAASDSTERTGFKEQWVLRWLLKKLASPGTVSSFSTCPQFWSLLINLTNSIPTSVCLEILVERNFYRTLSELIRHALSSDNVSPIHDTSSDAGDGSSSRPSKKRRLSPTTDITLNIKSKNKNSLWILLQAVCRCVELLVSPSAQHGNKPLQLSSLMQISVDEQAALLGSTLEVALAIIKTSPEMSEATLLSHMINVALSAWSCDSMSYGAHRDNLDHAFSSHCLAPCLHLLDVEARFGHSPLTSSKQALERLVAVHVVFSARSTFNAKDARNWRNAQDVLVYEQFEAMLKSFKRRFFAEEGAQRTNDIFNLSSLILDIAVRAIPSTDFRRWQAEQPWVEALFICLAHLTWPHMPRISSTGVVPNPMSGSADHERSLAALEELVDVARIHRLRISLPVLRYFIAAILAFGHDTTPWAVLLDTVRLDVNVLIPGTGLSKSEEILNSLLGKVVGSEVSTGIYQSLRDDLIIPLLRGFARSRDLDGYLVIWQQGLTDAMRARYTSKSQPDHIPAVLVWDDEDLFDEFGKLSLVHAPKSMPNHLLKELNESFEEITQNIGLTADTLAKVAIFSAMLENSQDLTMEWNPESDQLSILYKHLMSALSRKSDYLAQRWRLWKLVQLLLSTSGKGTLAEMGKQLLDPATQFVSLGEIATYQLRDLTRKRASKYLEALECFSTTLELSARSPTYSHHFETEMHHFRSLVDASAQSQSGDGSDTWSGRAFDCDSSRKLVYACAGKLLQKSAIIRDYPLVFGKLSELCLDILAKTKNPEEHDAIQANLRTLIGILLRTDEMHTATQLHQSILQRAVDEPNPNSGSFEIRKMLLEDVSEALMRRSQLKKLGSVLRQRLLAISGPIDIEAVSQDLALMLQIDDSISESLFDSRDWRAWINLSQETCRVGTAEPSMPLLAAMQMLDRILKLIWTRAISTFQTPALSEMIDWTRDTVKLSENEKHATTHLLGLQALVGQICSSKSLLGDIIAESKVRKLREQFFSVLERSLQQSPANNVILKNTIMIQLLIRAVSVMRDATSDESTRQVVSLLRDRSVVRSSSQKHPQSEGLEIYAEWEYMKLSPEQHPICTAEEILAQVQDLASFASKISRDHCESEQLALLCTRAHVIASRIKPTGMGDALQLLRKSSSQLTLDTPRCILTSAIISHANIDLMSCTPRLADELTYIVTLNASKCHDMTGLFLALENCKIVLHGYPLLINQSALDKLLASICMLGAYSLVPFPGTADSARDNQPGPVDLFDQCCAIIGIVLSRYRRRISDRYHLLLPVLQMLLRCLFWPGTETVRNRQHHGPAQNLNAFKETLPVWLHGSADSLPPSSAEKLSRLFSTICNPSVSAARSAKKGGHNELNDETMRAKHLAGQHMQYVVVGYTRCALDGQIMPTVKERLMPGMYAVLDSMDRELLRAMNAGMDPSSRAIFKNLYDDWTRFGKWDKT
ncbi:hypothetical protein PV08_06673 [Exophiala spinifera]|uniref:Nucleolar 27S pre-rRNA processing Urb2/Npa2 C-terminal domain-containing protein n=1 Tax=Exophiala spinifera TaxID=91928 RepID=A0A0D1ZM29_9EURO|nr:uncharacterized protein PV08_06673 [Exophiala spinifera]KIW13892.1 hypothetical protein PV08_06673 [Exophiala spinifera]